MKKVSKKIQLLIILGLLVALLAAVAVVQKVQETRRGAAGSTRLVDLELKDLSANPTQPLVERDGQEMVLAVEMKAKNESSMVGVRVAGVELSYASSILDISDLQCSPDFPVPIYSSISGGSVRISCYRPNDLGPHTLTTEPVSLATFKVSARNPGEHLTTVINFTRNNVPDATAGWTGKVEDVSDSGLAYVVPINPGEVPLDFACGLWCGDGAQLCPNDLGVGEEVDLYAKISHWGEGEVDYDWGVSKGGQELPLDDGLGTTTNCAGAETCQLSQNWSTYLAGTYTIFLNLENSEGQTASCHYVATVAADPTVTPTQECTTTRIQASDGEYSNRIAVSFGYNCPPDHEIKVTKDSEAYPGVSTSGSQSNTDRTVSFTDWTDCGQSFEYCAYGINTLTGEAYGVGGNCDQGNTSSCVGGGCSSNFNCFYTYADQDCVLGPVESPAPAPDGTRCSCDQASGACSLEDVSGSQCTIQGGVCSESPCDAGETDLGLLNCFYNSGTTTPDQTCCKPAAAPECRQDSDCAWFNGTCTKRVEGRIDPLGPVDGKVCGCDEVAGECVIEDEPVISISPEPPTATLTPEPGFECSCDNQEGIAFKAQGDGDCNGATDAIDYNRWFDAFIRGNQANDIYADFNCQGGVTIHDYEVWRRGAGF